MGTREREVSSMQKIKQTRRVTPASCDTLIDAIPQLVWTTRPDGLFEYMNKRYMDYTGLTLKQVHNSEPMIAGEGGGARMPTAITNSISADTLARPLPVCAHPSCLICVAKQNAHLVG